MGSFGDSHGTGQAANQLIANKTQTPPALAGLLAEELWLRFLRSLRFPKGFEQRFKVSAGIYASVPKCIEVGVLLGTPNAP